MSASSVTGWTAVLQAPLSMGFPRQEYWCGWTFPSPGEPSWPRGWTCLAGGCFTTHLPEKSIKLLEQLFTQSCPTLRPQGLQHVRPPCPSPTLGVYSNSVHWVSDAISSSVVPFSRLQCFPVVSSLHQVAKVLEDWYIQDWFPLGWTAWISLQQRDSQVLSNTTVQKHQFFIAQLSLWFNSHIHTWLLEKPQL